MSDRKHEHIDLAFKSQLSAIASDKRFIYEPMMAAHPEQYGQQMEFLGKTINNPIWVSSMTGGTGLAKKINENIARVCHDFGMGMGLGSCRILLDDDTYFEDFNVRRFIGDDLPMYANLGIAQIEELLDNNQLDKIRRLIDKLQADGLILHVNPLQEWFQPEGNKIKYAPIETIERLLEHIKFPLIVKEVGQGMGYESIKRLMQLPLQALDFGAFGGTNFSMLELYRTNKEIQQIYRPFAHIGQTAEDMIGDVNRIATEADIKCKQIIISGGIKSFLDGYFFTKRCMLPSVYGQASTILKYAKESYEELHAYVETQVKGLALAENYLRINPDFL